MTNSAWQSAWQSALPQPTMLIVEDSNEDFEAFMRYVRRSPHPVPVHRCTTGEHALAVLQHRDEGETSPHPLRPSLIVIDLNLPGTDGRDLLRQIKQDDNLKTIPIIVFTTSSNPKDIADCYQFGVNSYIVKPINIAQLKQDIHAIINYWFEVTTLPASLED